MFDSESISSASTLNPGSTLTLAAPDTASPVQIHVQSELMEHYEAAERIGVKGRMHLVHDQAGTEGSLLFIGGDGALYLASQDEKAHKGWRLQNISRALGDGAKVDTFDVHRHPRGSTQIAIAITRPADRRSSEILVTLALDFNNPGATAWRIRGKKPGVRMLHFDYAPMILDGYPGVDTLVARGNDGVLYRIDATNAAPKIQSLFRSAGPPILGYQRFQNRNEPGFWFTRENGQLSFHSFAGRAALYDEKPSALADDSDRHKPSRIYFVVGNRLKLKTETGIQEIARLNSIYSPDETCVEMSLEAVEGSKVIYMRTQSGRLLITEFQGQVNEKEYWSEPRRVRGDVQGFAGAPRGQGSTMGHEIFLASEEHLVHFWQDRQTTRWIAAEILLPAAKNLRRHRTSMTRIQVRDDEGKGHAEKKIHLRATEATWLTVNQERFFLERGEEKELRTDGHGSLTVIKQLSSVAVPRFEIKSDLFASAVRIDPIAHLGEKIRRESRKDLKSLHIGEGKRREKLLTGPFERNARAGAQALEKFADGLKRWQNGKSTFSGSPSKGATEMIWAADPASPFSSELSDAAACEDYCWSLGMEDGQLVFRDAGETRKELLAGLGSEIIDLSAHADRGPENGSNDNSKSWFGSILEHILHGIHDIAGLIFDGVNILIRTVEGVFRFAAKLAEQFLHVFKVAMKKFLGIDLDKIIKWLGFLFNWQDILATHDVMVRESKKLVKNSRAKLREFKRQMRTYLDGLTAKIDGLDVPRDVKGHNHLDLGTRNARHGGAGDEHGELVRKHRDTLQNHPATAWSSHQMTHGQTPGHAPASFFFSDLDAHQKRRLEEFFNTVKAHESAAKQGVERHHRKMESFYKSEDHGLDHIFTHFLHDLLKAGVAAVKEIATAFLDIVDILIVAIDKLLEDEIHIPVLTTLYKTIVGGGNKFTALNAMLLVAAIPTTVLSKALQGKAPFHDLENLELGGDLDQETYRKTLKEIWTTWVAGVGGFVLQTIRFGMRIIKTGFKSKWFRTVSLILQLGFVIMVCYELSPSIYPPEITALLVVWLTLVADLFISVAILEVPDPGRDVIAGILSLVAGIIFLAEHFILADIRLRNPDNTPTQKAMAVASFTQLGVLTPVARCANGLVPFAKNNGYALAAVVFVWLAADTSARLVHGARALVGVLRQTGQIPKYA